MSSCRGIDFILFFFFIFISLLRFAIGKSIKTLWFMKLKIWFILKLLFFFFFYLQKAYIEVFNLFNCFVKVIYVLMFYRKKSVELE